MDKGGGSGGWDAGEKTKPADAEDAGEARKPAGDNAPPPPGMDPDYVEFTSSLQSASARSSSTVAPDSASGSGTALHTRLAEVLNEKLLDPLWDTYHQGTEMVQVNVVDPVRYAYSKMTADNAAGLVQASQTMSKLHFKYVTIEVLGPLFSELNGMHSSSPFNRFLPALLELVLEQFAELSRDSEPVESLPAPNMHVVDPVSQAYQDMSAKATELVQTRVMDPVNQVYEGAPAYFQNTVVEPIKDAYNRAADMYDQNVTKPAAKAAGSFTDFLKSYSVWKDDKEGQMEEAYRGEGHKGGDHKAGDSKPPKTEEPRSPPKLPEGTKVPEPQKSTTEVPLKPALKRRDSLTIATQKRADHGGDGGAAVKSPDRQAEGGKGFPEAGHKVKFGYEEVRTLPPEKKRDKHDFNDVVEDQLGKITTKPTSQKDSKELIDAMLKEAMEAKSREEKKKRETKVSEEPDLGKTAGKAALSGKSVAGWVATPEEMQEYRKFQDMLHSRDKSGKKGDEGSAKGDRGPAHDKLEVHKPAGGAAKHHEEGHRPEAKPGDKHGGKDEAHKKAESGKKPDAGKTGGKPPGDQAGGKTEAKPSGKPHAVAPPVAGLAPAGHGPTYGRGPAHETGAATVKKSSSWTKALRRFFRRKPADEESSEEEGVQYREMDEEFIECAEDFGAAGEVAHGAGKGGASGGAADADAAASAPKQYKLNACLLVTSGAVIFVVLLAVLLSGDLFDDLDNSVPTFAIDTGKVVNFLDDAGFLGAGMNSSIMGKPGSWRPLLERPANDSLVLLLRGLAPAVLRFAGHETDHFYFVEGEEDGNSSRGGKEEHGGTDEGGLASRGKYMRDCIHIHMRQFWLVRILLETFSLSAIPANEGGFGGLPDLRERKRERPERCTRLVARVKPDKHRAKIAVTYYTLLRCWCKYSPAA
ncbi:uncharacterized protein [Dermacentor andersoni]|uniref:uncharacterized protein n=1 Tax=Dermacentor andersoni TaxID=34620 RepID=UPI0024180FA8|nr:uncharacterized protein LOC129384403 [Dermacentor andersoni]